MNKKFLTFWLFLIGCITVTACVTPLIYFAAQKTSSWGPFWAHLAHYPFQRYLHRVLQVCILMGAWPLLRKSGFFSWDALKLKSSRPFFIFSIGALTTMFCMAAYAGTLYFMGLYTLQDHLSMPAGVLLFKIISTAIVVSLFEEIFFRAFLYGIAKQEFGRMFALIFNAVFFASVHYLKPDSGSMISTVDWMSGFKMFGSAFQRFTNFPEMMGGLAVLMGLALVNCLSIERTKSLYLAMGIHAGGIFILQWSSELLKNNSTLPTWVSGGGDLSQGVFLAFVFLPLWLMLRIILKNQGLWHEAEST